MNKDWHKRTLSHNVKWYRSEAKLTQTDFAKITGLSYRIIQEIEAGKGNPTIETIGALARGLKTTSGRLLTLNKIRLNQSFEDFIKNYKKEFSKSSVAAKIRNLDGECIWRNNVSKKFFDILPKKNDGSNLKALLSNESFNTLSAQMNAEKNGAAYSYTLCLKGEGDGRPAAHIRCHPTLIFLGKNPHPEFTSVYQTAISEDCEVNYYEYCWGVLRSLYP